MLVGTQTTAYLINGDLTYKVDVDLNVLRVMMMNGIRYHIAMGKKTREAGRHGEEAIRVTRRRWPM
jgi:hypothetical protein